MISHFRIRTHIMGHWGTWLLSEHILVRIKNVQAKINPERIQTRISMSTVTVVLNPEYY